MTTFTKKLPTISGRGFAGGGDQGGGGQQQQQQQTTRTPDNLRTTDHVEFVIGLGQGPIKGLKDDDAKNYYIGDTPLMTPDGIEDPSFTGNNDGTPNFTNFTLEVFNGDGINNTVVLSQTGAALSHNVNVQFAQNVPVVRQGTISASSTTVTTLPASGSHIGAVYYIAGDGYWMWNPQNNGQTGWQRTNDPFVNFIQLRFLVNSLYSENNNGTFNNSMELKIEAKRSDQPDSAYVPAFYRTSTGDNVARKIGGGGTTDTGTAGDIINTLLISGKTTSNYVKEVRFPVVASNVPYTIRVTEITNPQNQRSDGGDFALCTWESFQEVTSQALRMDNLAFVHGIGQATNQFSSLPDFYGIFEGLIVRVPTNYDPVARTYTGLWDGTFKMAYTNNPAWCLYEFVTNDEWGMSSFNPLDMDKYDVYDAAQWCDGMVSDGKGGLQPRYTLNTVINEPRSANEQARYIAGAFNAIFLDDGNGTAHLRVDKDDPAIHLVTQESIGAGMFEYSYTDVTSRLNFVTVSYINPDLLWTEDRVTVSLPDAITEYGLIDDSIIAVGVNNQQEALRRGMYRIITATTEALIVSFKIPRLGQFMHPFEVMLIADPDLGYGLSGRLQTLDSGRLNATLRDPIYLESGVAYTASFQVPNPAYPDESSVPFEIVERTLINSTSGLTTNLQFNSALPDTIPEFAVFSIGQANGGVGLPKPFRITSVEKVEGDPDHMQVTGIELNRNKWNDVDNVSYSGIKTYSSMKINLMASVSNMAVVPTFHDGMVDMDISWDRVIGQAARNYTLEYSFNNGPLQQLSGDAGDLFHFYNQPIGAYTFVVRAVALNGNKSAPVAYSIDLTDPAIANPSGVAGITGLGMQGGVWKGGDVTFLWSAVEPANFSHFHVRVINPSNSAVLRTYDTTDMSFLYTYAMNQADHTGTAARSVTIEVTIITNNLDANNVAQTSAAVSGTFSNTAPAAPGHVTTKWVDAGLQVSFDPPVDMDFTNTLVWVRTDHSWNQTQVPSFTLSGNPITIPGLDRSQTYYIHLAHNDQFGVQATLNVSNELTITSGVPAAPTVPVLTAVRKKLGTTSARTVIQGTWTASTTPEFVDHYIAQIRDTVSSPWVDFFCTTTELDQIRYFTPITDAYQMRVKAVSLDGIASAWSTTVSASFTDDTTGPAAPTSLALQGNYNMIIASWVNPTDDDYAGTEVYIGTTTSRPASPTLVTLDSSYFMTGLNAGDVRYVWLRAMDFSGNGSSYVGPVNTAALAVPNLDTVAGAPGQVVGLGLSSSTNVNVDGSLSTILTANWTARGEADLADYEYQIKEGATGVVVSGFCDVNTYQWFVKPNTTYYVKVRAIDFAGNKGTFSTEVNATTSKDTTLPGNISSLTVLAGFENLFLNWINPSDPDFSYTEIWESTTNDRNTAALIARPQGTSFTKQNLAGGQTRYYWARAVDTSLNIGAWSTAQTAGVSGTTLNIASSTQIADGIITTAKISVGSLNGDRITAGTLSAAAITAGSVLSNAVVVGSAGPTLATILANAALGATDPASRINAGSTLIQPGLILLAGSTTLANWQKGGDTTKIDGGAISANTITANKISIGLRGIDIAGLEFGTAGNTLSWSAGTIIYIDDSGNPQTSNVAAGSVDWTAGTQYVYWTQGGTTLAATTDMPTAAGATKVIMATYRGGTDSVITYGRTLIDGSKIITNSITSNQLSTGLLLTQTAQIGDAIITSAKIASITAAQITTGTIGAQTITLGDSKFVMSGSLQNITVKDVNGTTRAILGNLGSGAFGLRISNASGVTIMDSSGVNGAMVTGLGTLAYANSADWSQLTSVPAFGGFAYLNGINSANIGTYFAGAAIGTAYIADGAITNAKIANLDASKITTGTLAAGQIAASSITTDKITVGGVTTTNLAMGAVTNAASYYHVGDISDGTPGTSIGSVTLTTGGEGVVNFVGFLSFVYTNTTQLIAVTSVTFPS